MRVLVAHNDYRSNAPSGENFAVDEDIVQLRAAGVDVTVMRPGSDAIRGSRAMAEAAVGPIVSPRGLIAFRRLVREEHPDILHVHNVYPLLSPWILREASRLGIATVQTIHNFRHDCVAGTYFRDNSTCYDCKNHFFAFPAVRHGCYRGSRVQTLPMAIGRTVHRRTWLGVDHYLVLTKHHADFLSGTGVPADRITIRPTATLDPGPTHPGGRDFLYIGRLDVEKGIRVLLAAWAGFAHHGRRLRIVGDGPLAEEVLKHAALDASVVYYGRLSPAEVAEQLRECGGVIIPSIWPEGLPRVLVESLSHGRAVCVSNHGGLASAVQDSFAWKITPNDATSLREALAAMTPQELTRRGVAARAHYLAELTPQRSLGTLLQVYREVGIRHV